MSHELYNFHFLRTVSEQLTAKLDALPISPLNAHTLQALGQFQAENNAIQGVYLLHLDGLPVYIGKAEDVRARLAQHLTKLSGRLNVVLANAGYKALLLDKSMSTAANETVLLGFFQQNHTGMWNNRGFGPKDPGRQRDNTRPSFFDSNFPINASFPIALDGTQMTVGELLSSMKSQLPYVFRYEVGTSGDVPIDVTGVPPVARELLHAVVRTLGPGWKGVILAFGMVLYRTTQHYEFGEELLP